MGLATKSTKHSGSNNESTLPSAHNQHCQFKPRRTATSFSQSILLEASMKHNSVRPLLTSPVLDSAGRTPMADTPASRTKKTRAHNTGEGNHEGSKSRKRPFEGYGLHRPQNEQLPRDSMEPKRQKFDAHTQGEASCHAESLQIFAYTIIQPELLASWSPPQPFRFPPKNSPNYLNQPGSMPYDQIQVSRIQNILSMRRSRVPQFNQSPPLPTMSSRQPSELNPKPTIRPECQILHEPPPSSYRTPPSQFTTNVHTRLPTRATVMSTPRRRQKSFVTTDQNQTQRNSTRDSRSLSPESPASVGKIPSPRRQQTNPVAADWGHAQRNTTIPSQSLSPELPGVAERAYQIRRERDAARCSPHDSAEPTHQKSLSQPRLIDPNSPKICFVPPTLPPISYLDIMYNYDADDLELYLKFLGSLQILDYKVGGKHLTTARITQGHDPKLYNDWLLSLLPIGRKETQTFRSLKPPEKYNYSLLARCIRFAQSSAEKTFSWTVHPNHITLIMERTDEYGKARINEKEDKVEERLKNRRIIDGMKKLFALVKPAEIFEEYVGIRTKLVFKG
jgi:hypothetical protein